MEVECLKNWLAPLASCALLAAGGAQAAEEMSANEIAKKLANPAGSLASLATRMVYTEFQGDLPGADNQDSWSFQFQPVLPFPVGDEDRRIIFRPQINAVFNQPVFDGEKADFDSLDVNLGDTTFDLVYAGNEMETKHTGYLWGVGLAGTLPTATNNALGGDQWRFGPELFGGFIRPWGVIGGLVSNQWNTGGGDGGPGSNDQAYSATTAQYFYAITLKNGWQITSSPVVSYDWKADDSDDALSLPVGTGIAKTTKIGRTNWRFMVEGWYYLEQPDQFGADFLVRFEARPVIANPLIGLFK